MVSNEIRELTGQQLLRRHHPRATTEVEDDNRHSYKDGDLLVSHWSPEEERTSPHRLDTDNKARPQQRRTQMA